MRLDEEDEEEDDEEGDEDEEEEDEDERDGDGEGEGAGEGVGATGTSVDLLRWDCAGWAVTCARAGVDGRAVLAVGGDDTTLEKKADKKDLGCDWGVGCLETEGPGGSGVVVFRLATDGAVAGLAGGVSTCVRTDVLLGRGEDGGCSVEAGSGGDGAVVGLRAVLDRGGVGWRTGSGAGGGVVAPLRIDGAVAGLLDGESTAVDAGESMAVDAGDLPRAGGMKVTEPRGVGAVAGLCALRAGVSVADRWGVGAVPGLCALRAGVDGADGWGVEAVAGLRALLESEGGCVESVVAVLGLGVTRRGLDMVGGRGVSLRCGEEQGWFISTHFMTTCWLWPAWPTPRCWRGRGTRAGTRRCRPRCR